MLFEDSPADCVCLRCMAPLSFLLERKLQASRKVISESSDRPSHPRHCWRNGDSNANGDGFIPDVESSSWETRKPNREWQRPLDGGSNSFFLVKLMPGYSCVFHY